jgi:4-diphosphocytidyl-2-C-methyl-D-erythritol kinase
VLGFPNAKINLGLQIIAKRPDGYHDLASCFYPVAWCDALELCPADTLAFYSYGLEIPPSPGHNLCLRAYHLLAQDHALAPVGIHLLKAIPIGAGLGGGSANAAFCLKLLNDYNGLHLSTLQLESYARQLGSDCAFFIQNKAMMCYEKGDIFEETTVSLAGKHVFLVYPNLHISTAEAYAGVQAKKPKVALADIINLPTSQWAKLLHNQFEDHLFVKHPILHTIKQELYQQGAIYAAMSGSGSTLYGIFEEEPQLQGFEKYLCHKAVLL